MKYLFHPFHASTLPPTSKFKLPDRYSKANGIFANEIHCSLQMNLKPYPSFTLMSSPHDEAAYMNAYAAALSSPATPPTPQPTKRDRSTGPLPMYIVPAPDI